jgi:hypothetical protein
MNTMKKILLLILLNATTMLAWSQDIATATIKWNSESTFDAGSGNRTVENTSVTTRQNTVEWRNDDGSMRKSFQIIERIGEWNNISGDGQVQYEVTDGQYSGTISVRKNGSETKILMVIASGESGTTELIIAGYQTL